MTDNPRLRSIASRLRTGTGMTVKVTGGDLTPRQAVFQLPPSKTHIVWLVGHLAWSTDSFVGPMLGRETTLPPAYRELFRFGTEPSADSNAYPALAELVEALQRVSEEAASHLESLDDSVLDQPVPEDSPAKDMFATIGAMLDMTAFHAGYHTGQIVLLRRAQGLPGGLGI